MADELLGKVERAMNPEPKKFVEPSKKRPDTSKNLGKFLHPRKEVPAGQANGTMDANTGNGKAQSTQ